MITLYHLGVSQSDRIVWLMEELKIPYKLEWYDRGPNGMAPDEYKQLHPVGTAPIIKDGDVVLSESAAIVEYISHRYGNSALSVAAEEPSYPDYLYWMQFNNNAQLVLFTKMALAEQSGGEQENPILDIIQRREDAYYNHLNEHLANSKYLAGDSLSCADILAVFNLTTLPMFGGRVVDDLPNVQAYLARIGQRPAYIKAMEIAGPEAKNPAAARQ